MTDQEKRKYSRLIIVILILIAIVCGYLLYKSGVGGVGNSCSALRRQYEKAKAVEDYGKVSEYYGRMNELGCEF